MKKRHMMMPKRIPHSDLEVITGTQTAKEYLEMQKKLGGFYLGRFLKLLTKLSYSQ